MSLLCRLKKLVYKGILKAEDIERIVIIPKGQKPCDCVSREAVINEIHATIITFFDMCEDNEEIPMDDKDELLLSVNKAICNNIKAMKPITSKKEE